MFEIYKVSTGKVIADNLTAQQAWKFRLFQPDMADLVIRPMT